MNDQIRKGLQKIHAITSAVLEASEGEPNEDVIAGLRWLRMQMLPEDICKVQWFVGRKRLDEPHAPTQGARCQFKRGHAGHHSFIVDALARGWVDRDDDRDNLKSPEPPPE